MPVNHLSCKAKKGSQAFFILSVKFFYFIEIFYMKIIMKLLDKEAD